MRFGIGMTWCLALAAFAGLAGLDLSLVADTPLKPNTSAVPLQLEQERIGPTTQPLASAIPRRPGYGTVRLASRAYLGDPRYDIYLLIPERFVGSRADHVTQGWGIDLFAYYPEMTGEYDVGTENQVCWTCTRQPEGELLIYIANDAGYGSSHEHAPERAYKSLMEWIKTKPENRLTYDIQTTNPDRVVIIEGTNLEVSSQQIDVIYKKNGQTDGFIHCFPHNRVPSCQADVMSLEQEDLAIRFSFSMSLISQFPSLENSVIRLVDGFLINPKPPAAGAK